MNKKKGSLLFNSPLSLTGKNKRGDFSSSQILKWILYLGILIVGILAFRSIFLKFG